MRKKGMILAVLSLLLMFPFTGAWADSRYWDFSSGLDMTMFFTYQNNSFTLNDSGGNLLISKGSTGPPGEPYYYYGVNSQFLMQGNFDIRVDYNLVSALNPNDGILLGIMGALGDPSLKLWRDNVWFTPENPNPGNAYHAGNFQNTWNGTTQTTDTYGTLRLQRTDSSVAASVIHDGVTTPIYTFDFGTPDVFLYMTLIQTQTSAFGPMACSWDNLYATADNFTYPNPVPLPGAFWLLGSGLLGLIPLGRRKREKNN